MSTEAEKTPKTEKKPEKEKKGNSFFKNLKGSLMVEIVEEDDKDTDQKTDQKTSSDTLPTSSDTSVKDEASDSPKKPDKSKESEGPENSQEDPTLQLFNGLKDHEKLQSLRKRKDTIIKVTASIVSILLIIIGIIYSINPNENVASNVIFGERAMFSAFLILVAFMILAAVYSRKLLEGKYFKNIHKDLEIAEGKKPKDETKNSQSDPVTEHMNKKNK